MWLDMRYIKPNKITLCKNRNLIGKKPARLFAFTKILNEELCSLTWRVSCHLTLFAVEYAAHVNCWDDFKNPFFGKRMRFISFDDLCSSFTRFFDPKNLSNKTTFYVYKENESAELFYILPSASSCSN